MDRTNPVVATAVRWFEEVSNQRREATIDELLSETSVCYAESGPIVGPGQFRTAMYLPFLATFPDLKVTVDDAIGDENRAVVRWSASGTHQGAGLGIVPTGKVVAFRGMTWMSVDNGKLAEG